MQDNKLFNGSICITDLMDAFKQKHSSFVKSKNGKIYGKIYVNISVWVNSEKDDFGNQVAIKLGKKKDSNDPTPYIGNAKPVERHEPPPPSETDIQEMSETFDDAPPF